VAGDHGADAGVGHGLSCTATEGVGNSPRV
jgi:hypothetical protein